VRDLHLHGVRTFGKSVQVCIEHRQLTLSLDRHLCFQDASFEVELTGHDVLGLGWQLVANDPADPVL
jgi:hypothetical protein